MGNGEEGEKTVRRPKGLGWIRVSDGGEARIACPLPTHKIDSQALDSCEKWVEAQEANTQKVSVFSLCSFASGWSAVIT